MLLALTEPQQNHIDRLMREMSVEDMIGQTLCPVSWNFGVEPALETVERTLAMVGQHRLGAVFLAHGPAEIYLKLKKQLRGLTKIPVLVNADIEFGIGGRVDGQALMPASMACGATGDPELAYRMGVACGYEGRYYGVHWTLAPVSDLCLNQFNPMTFGRCYGSRPPHVEKMARAFIRGVQRDRQMAAAAKHFPGDGAEDREPHVCTAINRLSKKDWFGSYGQVWKGVIDEGVMSIMTGHIGLKWKDKGDYRGPRAATLSKKIQLDLLRDELGFQGLIICDAMIMMGMACYEPIEERAWKCVESGTDSYLFSLPHIDAPNMLRAVREKKLSEKRLEFAARKVLELKARVGLFDDLEVAAIDPEQHAGFVAAGEEIARRSITLIRDENRLLPLQPKPGARVLTVTLCFTEGVRHGKLSDLPVVDAELRRRGLVVDHEVNPSWTVLAERSRDYEIIFVNLCIPPRYGTARLCGAPGEALWGGYLNNNPRVVYTSFGDPFKLYEFPYAASWLNAYCEAEATQRAVVKVWLGEEKPLGKSPVTLPGFFNAEV